MMPSAYEVAVAIVTASRITGADPVDVVSGTPPSNYDNARMVAASRARVYASYALDRVFNRPTPVVSKTAIARMVGVREASRGVYFTSTEQRPKPWFNEADLKKVVDAVMDADPPAPGLAERVGTTDPDGGFRPAVGTYEKELGAKPLPKKPAPRLNRALRVVDPAPRSASDAADAPRTGLDRFVDRFGSPPGADRKPSERQSLQQILADAARNTAALTPPPEPEGEQ